MTTTTVTTYTCDMCKKTSDLEVSVLFSRLDVLADDNKKYWSADDVCFECHTILEKYIAQYAKKNRLSILITEGRVV